MPGARSSGDTEGPEGVWELATLVTADGEREYLFNRARELEIWVDDVFNAADAYREITSSCAEPRSKNTRPDLEELPVAVTDTADQPRKRSIAGTTRSAVAVRGTGARTFTNWTYVNIILNTATVTMAKNASIYTPSHALQLKVVSRSQGLSEAGLDCGT